jgi:dsDNA-binding SOS-regulon protein
MFPDEIRIKTRTLLLIALSPPGAFLLGALVVLIFRNWPTESAAAWVQAVGSVLAIIVAVAVARNQSQQMLRAAKEAERELLDKLLVVAKFVMEVSNNAYMCLEDDAGDTHLISRFEASLQECNYLLREIQFDEVPRAEAAIGWLELRAAARDVLHYVQVIQSGKLTATALFDFQLAAAKTTEAFERILAAATVD